MNIPMRIEKLGEEERGPLHAKLHPSDAKISVSEIDKAETQPKRKKILAAQAFSVTPSTNQAIRARFLNRLGIRPNGRSPPQESTIRGPLRSNSFCESLKADRGAPDPAIEDDSSCVTASSSSMDSYASQLSDSSQPRKVSFRTTVTVHPIPARSSYSDRMRRQLWTPPDIQVQNTARNVFEFAAEEWDWTKVVDDEFFINWNGERIHPIHLQECNLNQHFLSVMAQR